MKFYHALNMQAVVENRCLFISIDIRSGSWSDQKIWNASRLRKTLDKVIPPDTHMISDAGYAIRLRLMTPYPETFDYTKTRRFNFAHSSIRMVVERAFGVIKERFRVLKACIDVDDVGRAVNILDTSIVLHNILIALGDDDVDFDVPVA
ncbi:hypothetical protein PHMEG_00011739 [Phytophthora megakarya]|uniref:DDE Tnp4 domain-containing protein n=1 Tax=Phytophthora megakarya TaxID=4795 RepID=A0A225WB03_9STRA|nr:hypothetical protein PHMEG_00011739 [Phytophthora megakarya]